MKALCFDGRLALRELPEPRPGPDEALVRVRMAGICNTDVEIARGYMGFEGVLGHELVGVVQEAPDPVWVGRRVCAEINLACGRCDACLRGMGRHCPTRRVLGILGKDGCFAEWVTLPLANLHAVPEGMADETAVFTEPLAAAHEVLQQVAVDPDARVLVLGDGKLGLLVALVLVHTGADVTLVGKHDAKLAIGRRAGARTAVPQDLTEHGFDVVVEATGSPDGLAMALDRIRPRGTLVLKSTFHGKPEVDTAKLVIDEIHVVGSRCGPFPPALRALAQHRIDPAPLVSATRPLSDAVAAFEHAQAPGVLKVLLDMR
ncbi:MAG: MDR/zinc-dependent alcohol dehydrogenase-like family protein [Myxococcota bacterium]